MSKKYAKILILVMAMAFTVEAFSEEINCAHSGPFSDIKGINVNLNSQLNDNDISKISSWGANSLRVAVHADNSKKRNKVFLDENGNFNDLFFKRLDRLIELSENHGISIVIALMTEPGHQQELMWSNDSFKEKFFELWESIASRYKNKPSVVAYDLLNEPRIFNNKEKATIRKIHRADYEYLPNEIRSKYSDYYKTIGAVSRVINRISPMKKIIVQGVGIGGHPMNFKWMKKINACNIVYSFHLYVPHDFTHAHKGRFFEKYKRDEDLKKIILAIQPVIDFQISEAVDVYVGEFGVVWQNEGNGASEWIEDVTTIFQVNNWSWSYWSYSIPPRNPELTFKNGEYVFSKNPERLNALKNAWGAND